MRQAGPTWTDGREIDPALGALGGEAAAMNVTRRADATHQGSAGSPTSRAAAPLGDDPTYYDLPVIQEPVWIWSIPAYFFVGGTAGVADVLAGCCELVSPRAYEPFVRHALRLALAGEVVGSALLIHDLGRPSRFLNMLRVFRPTSPMSVGSWLLAATGTVTGAAVVLRGRAGLLGRLGRGAGLAGALLGGPLAGYTGVLLANTAVPVWSAAHRTLPPLFVASSASSAGWTLSLLPVGPRGQRLARRVAVLGTLAELLCASAVRRDVSRVPRVARPLERGVSGVLWRGAGLLGVAAVATAGASRWRLAAGLGLGAALLRRFAVFHAGKASARDPRATFHQQRARLDRRDEAR